MVIFDLRDFLAIRQAQGHPESIEGWRAKYGKQKIMKNNMERK